MKIKFLIICLLLLNANIKATGNPPIESFDYNPATKQFLIKYFNSVEALYLTDSLGNVLNVIHQNIGRDSLLFCPKLSRDGQRALFLRKSYETKMVDIVVVDLRTLKKFTLPLEQKLIYEAEFSRYDSSIYFVAHNKPGFKFKGQDIYKYNSFKTVRLTKFASYDLLDLRSIRYGSKDNMLAFIKDRRRIYCIEPIPKSELVDITPGLKYKDSLNSFIDVFNPFFITLNFVNNDSIMRFATSPQIFQINMSKLRSEKPTHFANRTRERMTNYKYDWERGLTFFIDSHSITPEIIYFRDATPTKLEKIGFIIVEE